MADLMVGVWRWVAVDLRTGLALGDVPLTAWSCTDKVSDSGEWAATLPSPTGWIDTLDLLSRSTPGRTVLVALRDNQVMAAGIVWSRKRPSIAGAGLFSYLDRRHLVAGRTYTDDDQFDIVRALVDWQEANGGVPFDVSPNLSGVLRSQQWRSWEAKNIGEAIRQMADAEDGFDFSTTAVIDPVASTASEPQLRWRLDLWAARRGRPWPQSDVRFVNGKNAVIPVDVDESGASLATRITGLGAETDSTTQERLRVTADKSAMLAAGYPVLDAVLDVNDVRSTSALTAQVNGALRTVGRADLGDLTIVVDPDHPIAPWSTWSIGDDCRLIIDPGVDPWYPAGYQVTRRIVATKWTVTATGEQLEVVTGPPWAAA